MPVSIAVLDPVPTFRQGMLAILVEAGFAAETPEDLFHWVHQDHRKVVLLTLGTAVDWMVLERLRSETPEVVVIAVLADASVQSCVRAVVAGAMAVVARDADPEMVRRVFEDAVRGVSALPLDVVAALAAPHERSEHVQEPSESELAWLQGLANGATVSQLAERSGYSERAMFRLLRELYGRLEVKNRTEALMLSQRRGWL
jgi:DNA-binding NarL/FixJ family response regulator